MPGLVHKPRSPLFIGASQCDGELLVRVPFNEALAWELTHIVIRATHPPSPGSRPPRTLGAIPNQPSASFSDFDDPTAPLVEFQDMGDAGFVASFEGFRARGTFKRCTCVAFRLSVKSPEADDCEAEESDEVVDVQVFINDIALFGLPASGDARAPRSRMYDRRAELIVSPVFNRRRWGEGDAAKPDAAVEDDADV